MIQRDTIRFTPRKVAPFARALSPLSMPSAGLRAALAGTALGLAGLAGLAFAAPLAAGALTSLPELGIDAGPQLGGGHLASAGFSGTCSENLQAVALSVRHSISGQRVEAPAVLCADGIWQVSGIDLSGLSDGPLIVEAQHNDLAGQRIALSGSLLKGGGAPRVGIDAPALIHPGNLEAYPLSGTCSAEGQKIALTLNDGQGQRAASAQPVCTGQRWSTALSGLAALDEGLITLTVAHSEPSVGTATLIAQALKNTVLPGLSIDPLLGVKAINQAAFPLSGTCSEAKQPVVLAVSDRYKLTVYGEALCSGKGWNLPGIDLSPLSGGELRFVATHANAVQAVRTVLQVGLKEASAAASSAAATTALSAAAPGAPASSGAATPASSLLPAQSITFNRLANKTLGDAPFSVAATASSGLPVSFSSLTPQLCTSTGHQGSTISLLLLGTCTLQANQAGTTQIAAALPVAQSFTVGVAQRDAMLGQPAVAAGRNHTIAIKLGGSVWTWGSNDRGQLGDGSHALRSTPVLVSGLSANGVGAGAAHSVALQTDGTIKTWGSNDFGQLGNGAANTADVTAPAALSGASLPLFSAIAVGAHHTLALAGGDVWAWGANGDGQIGQTTLLFNATPSKISGLTGVIALAAGENHSLALKSDGTVWTWGRNAQGQLGNNTKVGSATPVPVLASVNNPLKGITAIAAGGEHSLALKSDGSVLAWGSDWAGQLGNGSAAGSALMPGAVLNLAEVKAISAGNAYSLALKTEGSVWAWGYGAAGQIGNGSSLANQTPIAVDNNLNSGVTTLAAGDNHAIAIKADGAVYAWGNNNRGQLGEGMLTFRQEPIDLTDPDINSATTVTVGAYHLLTKNAAKTKVWGSNWLGQLADTSDYLDTPTEATAFSSMAAAAAGYGHTLTLQSDGTVQAVGGNWAGQLGDGNSSPTPIRTPVTVSNLRTPTALAAGGQHSLAITKDQTVVAWGANDAGQLGDGSAIPKTSPVSVNTLSGATALAAGYAHSVALKTGGSVWTWGNNLFGQLGDSLTANRLVPAQVPSLGAVTQIAAGMYHTLALVGGEVWAWGSNSAGQLGDSTTVDRRAPVKVPSLPGITKIVAGSHHTLALKSDGTVWAWGRNDYGQLGDASLAYSSTPLLLALKDDAKAQDIAAGDGYSVILTTNGKIQIMGDGRDGELGLGSSAQAAAIRKTPVPTMINLQGGSAVSLSPVPSVPTTTSPSFTATSSVAGKAYWILVRSFQVAPTAAQIKGGGDVGYGIFASGNGDISAGGSLVITPPALTAGKAYRLFVCVASTAANPCTSNTANVDFMTAKAGSAAPPTLTVTIAGPSGAGFVTSNVKGADGAALYCASGTCPAKTYAVGQSVTLQAFSAPGATFSGWTGTGCSGTSLTCTVSATASVTASFNRTDVGGTVLFPKTSYTVVPGKTTTLTIARSGNTDNAASVNIACSETGSANNCGLFPTSLSFVAGQSSASFTVSVPASRTGSVQLTLSPGTGSPTIASSSNKITVNLRKSVNLTPILMLLLN